MDAAPEDPCPICLDVIEDSLKLGCGHIFCRDCIHTACHGTLVPTCPMCRSPIETAVVPIFVDSLPDEESQADADADWDDSSEGLLEGIIIYGPTEIDSDGDQIVPSDDESELSAFESGSEWESSDSVLL